MRTLLRSFVQFFTSLQLTVTLLVLSMILVFIATLDQVHLGIWGVQQKYFRSFFVLWHFPGTQVPIPVFPGGYFIGGLLFINLIAAHVYRFRLSWKKAGIFLTHVGLLLLLVGELLSGLWQEDYQMRLDEGQTRNYSESPRLTELAIVDTTDPQWDDVVAVSEELLSRESELQHPKLPFRIAVRSYYPNAAVQTRTQAPTAAPSLATRDFGQQLAVTPLPITYREDQSNFPTAHVELIGAEGTLGIWLVSAQIGRRQTFDHAGRKWSLLMRPRREYKPFSLTLLDFSHDRYAGTEIPKNFSSKVRLRSEDGQTDREVLIYMNNPLRYEGLTFYQAGFANDDKTTVLQVVRNPSWLLPYVACALMSLGLLVQFGLSLGGFIRKRSRSAAVTT